MVHDKQFISTDRGTYYLLSVFFKEKSSCPIRHEIVIYYESVGIENIEGDK